MLPDAALATSADVNDWLRLMDPIGVLNFRMTMRGPVLESGVDEVDARTAEWLSILSDFRTETTRGLHRDLLVGFDAPAVLTENIVLGIDRMPAKLRSHAYRNERSGISELRRMVNRVTGEGSAPRVHARALNDAARWAEYFLDCDLCPNLRARFFEAWERALTAASDSIAIGRADLMELPYPPPYTMLPESERTFVRLGDVWGEQRYTRDDVQRWLDEVERAVDPSRLALRRVEQLLPPTIGGPTRCSHFGQYMTFAPVSVPD